MTEDGGGRSAGRLGRPLPVRVALRMGWDGMGCAVACLFVLGLHHLGKHQGFTKFDLLRNSSLAGPRRQSVPAQGPAEWGRQEA